MIPAFLVTVGVIAGVALTLFTVWSLGVGRGEQIGWNEAFRLHLDPSGRQQLPQPLRDYLAEGDGPEAAPLWTPADHDTWDDAGADA